MAPFIVYPIGTIRIAEAGPGLDRVENCREPAWHETWPKSYDEARAAGNQC